MVAGCVKQTVINTGTVVWELAWVDSMLIVLDESSSYRSGHLSRFEGTIKKVCFNWLPLENIYPSKNSLLFQGDSGEKSPRISERRKFFCSSFLLKSFLSNCFSK